MVRKLCVFIALSILIVCIPFFILKKGLSSRKKETLNTSSTALSPYTTITFSDPLLNKPDSLLRIRKYDSAIVYYKLASSLFEKKKRWQGYVRSLTKAGISFKRKKCHTCDDSAFFYISKAEEYCRQYLGKEHIEMGTVHYYWGEFYMDSSARDALDHYLTNASIINNYFHQKASLLIVNDYSLIGEIYFRQLGDYDKAERFYKKAADALDEIKDSIKDINMELAEVYLLIAKVNRAKGDYYQGIDYGKRAVELASTLDESNFDFIGNCNVVLANIYYGDKNYKSAEPFYKKAIALVTQYDSTGFSLVNYYNNLAACQIELGKLKEAAINSNKSEAVNHGLNIDLLERSNSYINLSKIYASQFNNSLNYLNKSLQIRRRLYSEKNEKVAYVYNEMAYHFKEKGDHHMALRFYQKALNSLLTGYCTNDIFLNPPDSTLYNSHQLFETFNNKALALKALYTSDTTDKHSLQKSVENFLLADKVMKKNRNSYEKEESKLFLMENYKKNYEEALDALFLLNKECPDHKDLESTFHFMENSKSSLLAEAINKYNLKATIPADVLDKEKELEDKVIDYTLQSTKAYSLPKNEKNIRSVESSLFSADRDLQKFTKKYTLLYPFYFNSKNKVQSLSLQVVQSTLAKKQKIIEFFWGEHAIYSLMISSTSALFKKISLTQTLKKEIETTIKLVSSFRRDSIQADFQQFKALSYKMYVTLLKPSDSSAIPESDIIIVSDGLLMLLPFETLTTELRNTDGNMYKDLPYLINTHNISYSYSTDLLMPYLINKDLRVIKNLVAFENMKSSDEFNTIMCKLSAGYFHEEQCTKRNFKQQLSQCDAIHITTHGKGSKIDSLGARLFFNSRDTSSQEDDILYEKELYDQNLNHIELFVLNACETGKGKVCNGEGVFSVARGVTAAGGKSILLSLMEIPQKTTDNILNTFYRKIASGKKLNDALRESKLNYIKQQQDGNTAHPYFWSGLILLGDSRPISFKSPGKSSLLTVILFSISIILIIASLVYFHKKFRH